jgi:Tol biopolymer transport system component
MKMYFMSSGLVLALVLPLRVAASDGLQVVTSAAVSSNVTGAGHSMMPVISADGRFVVFMSQANNLATNDDLRPHLDVFIRDLQQGSTALLSADRSGVGGGNSDSSHPAISTDGRFVLFSSYASNLASNDTNNASDVFLHDRQSGRTMLVSATAAGSVATSLSTNGSGSPFLGSSKPVMTPDARWIVFESTAHDLVNDDTNGLADVFVRNTQSGNTMMVSVGARRGESGDASITPDGRRIAFRSSADHLIAGLTNRHGEIYVRDLQAVGTIWASSNLAAYFIDAPDTYRCSNPVMSPDGRYVVFKGATNPAIVHLFYHDLETGSTVAIATNSWPNTCATFSADGAWIAYEENSNIYRRDNETGSRILISADQMGGPADGVSHTPVISPDGLWVAFISSATNLVPGIQATNRSKGYLRDVDGSQTYLISVATNGGPTSFSIDGALAAMSADASRIAFDTDGSDLAADDNNRAYDVFVRDWRTNTTRIVSTAHPALVPRTGLQSAGISPQSVSADGSRIAFWSFDNPRTGSDTNRYQDLFVQDLATGTTLPMSSPGGTSTNGAAFDPLISANGECVAYLQQTRVGPNYFDRQTYLYWRPVAGGNPVLVTVRPFAYGSHRWLAALTPDGSTVAYRAGDGVGEGLFWTNMISRTGGAVDQTRYGFPARNYESRNPAFSASGQWIGFVSSDLQLTSNWIVGTHMYIRNLTQTNSTRVLSVDTNGVPLANAAASSGSFSGNDRYVVFDGVFMTNSQPQIYRYDLQTGRNRLVCTNCINPSISADGQLIAYNSTYGGILSRSNIFVADLITSETEVIGRDYAGNGIANNHFNPPLLSADGRYVVFESILTNLVANDANRVSDIFVYDRVWRTTMLVSRSRFGPRAAAGISSKPVMSPDGRTVVFQSFANDLVEGDYNERRDIFVLRLGVGDSDNDGMDDDWEVAYFDNLERSGAGDYDGDGSTDLQEFVSGTDPRNSGSVLRVLTISPMGGGSTTVVWSAVPNHNYVVQYKDSLEAANWTNASGVLTASSTSESFLHASSAGMRYYRVIAVQ